MTKALGFMVEGVPLCCRCTEDAAWKSGYTHLFFTVNKSFAVDSNKRCVCGEQMGSKANQEAAERLIGLMGEE